MNAQTISSAKTSIPQVPALHKWAYSYGYLNPGVIVVDYGCGGFDHGMLYCQEKGCWWRGYDPYHRSPSANHDAIATLVQGDADVVLCANVLNVINNAGARAQVIRSACSGLRKMAQVALFQTYEGDRSGTGRITSKGWQENRKVSTYVEEIKQALGKDYTVVRKGPTIIVRINKL
jgi:hypothetical protein